MCEIVGLYDDSVASCIAQDLEWFYNVISTIENLSTAVISNNWQTPTTGQFESLSNGEIPRARFAQMVGHDASEQRSVWDFISDSNTW